MKVVKGYPPNFNTISAALPSAKSPGAIFCYGDTIYNPSGNELSAALLAHEAVHSRQQGDNPEAWWHTYILNRRFRFEQELAAHQEEYRVATVNHGRHERRAWLKIIASRLAGKLYGHLVSLDTAKKMVAA